MAAASARAAKPGAAGAAGKSVGLELHFAVWDNDLGALAKLLEVSPKGVATHDSVGVDQNCAGARDLCAAAGMGSHACLCAVSLGRVWRLATRVHDPAKRARLQPQADTHDLETQDRTGASAYVLALKLGHTRAAHMLIRAGACPRAKTALGWEPIQLAALTANSDLTRIAVVSMLKDMDLAWERRLPKHLDRLRSMPGELWHYFKRARAQVAWRRISSPQPRRHGLPRQRSPLPSALHALFQSAAAAIIHGPGGQRYSEPSAVREGHSPRNVLSPPNHSPLPMPPLTRLPAQTL